MSVVSTALLHSKVPTHFLPLNLYSSAKDLISPAAAAQTPEMAGFTWTLTLLCVTGSHHLSPASPALRSAKVVQAGQNVSLACNLTCSVELTWYVLRSDQLLPLLTVTESKIGSDAVAFHTSDSRRFSSQGDLELGPVSLEILQVEEKDAGLYFCTRRAGGRVSVNTGIYLMVKGADVDPARDRMRQPCWSVGLCVLPALLSVSFLFVIVGFYLCSGKPAVCSCHPGRRGSAPGVIEDVPLHYSNVKPAVRPRPFGLGRTGLVKEDVTYSTVSTSPRLNAVE
ncbi:uncharacterized protein LOC113126110 [Mastacembelus armatus]|uniref:uncharacterized protein LOC113126110 n=1 Tax=Mastacembelus armatus TaxID=205130 RepID=UPI001436A87F|nr:uncharacterized protein LOC113126110 [Mastacembelus armatus]